MLGQLKVEDFNAYPPQARQLAGQHIPVLRQLPPSILLLLLREIIAYDWKFPAERKDLNRQLNYLDSLSAQQFQEVVTGFSHLRVSPEFQRLDGVNAPARYSEQLTAHLWATHQIDDFRAAAVDYMRRLDMASSAEPLPIPRLGIVVVGQGVAENKYRLFRKLRSRGAYFTQVNPENGLQILLETVTTRAAAHPVPYGHWYIDGGVEETVSGTWLTRVSYNSLESVRTALLSKIERTIKSGGGPEALRTALAQLRPEDLGLNAAFGDAVLDRFQISVLTEGSGTQIFSTTFVQWAAREALRRAQPLTLLARFSPRQRQRPMNELFSGTQKAPVLDPVGSLIDADMAAYYTWLNQQRLSGAESSSFLVWFEGHDEALVVAPSLRPGTEYNDPVDLSVLLSRIHLKRNKDN